MIKSQILKVEGDGSFRNNPDGSDERTEIDSENPDFPQTKIAKENMPLFSRVASKL